jgi:hypothetical protein
VHARLRGPQIDIASAEQLLEREALFGRVGMQREVYPLDPDVEISLQPFNTPGTEIAPRSNVIAEDFKRDRLGHLPLLELAWTPQSTNLSPSMMGFALTPQRSPAIV